MVSKEFLQVLGRRHQDATGSTLHAAMAAIADKYGYASFESLMGADERRELNDDDRADLFRELSPYIERAFEITEKKAEKPADWQEALNQILEAIRKFLFGYTQEELAEAQADAELSTMLTRVQTAQDVRDKKIVVLTNAELAPRRAVAGP